MTKRKAYPVPEVAELLGGITERTVWHLIARGDLKSFKLGRLRLVHEEDLDAYLTALRDDEARARASVRGAA